MTKYNFNLLANRKETNSIKWNVENNCLPMSIADMDFITPNFIKEAFIKRINESAYGYTGLSDNFYISYINWWKNYHNLIFKKENMIFSTGVVAAISASIRRLSNIANNVVVLSPVYNIFYNCIENNGRHTLQSNLKYENYTYSIDFEDLENKLALEETSILLLCNPHNPIGKIWSKEELAKIGELAYKYHVVVISDEIHCDLTYPNYNYIPFASVNKINKENSITLISPSKTFNIAGLQSALIVAYNPYLKHLVERGLNTSECAEPNILASIAPEIVFSNNGRNYLDQLRIYLNENRKLVEEKLKLTELKLIESKATYLLWIDCSCFKNKTREFIDFIYENTKLIVSKGEVYRGNGNNFIRLNIATSKEYVLEGTNRLLQAYTNFKKLIKE